MAADYVTNVSLGCEPFTRAVGIYAAKNPF